MLDGNSARSQRGHSTPQFWPTCCGQTAALIKVPLGTGVGLGPGHIVSGGPSSPLKGAHHPPPQQFSARVCCGQMAGWMKLPFGAEIGLGPDDIVLNGDSAPLERGTAPSPLFGPCLLWRNGCTEVDLGPGHIVFDGAQLPPPRKGHSTLSLRPMSIVAKRSPISATTELLLYNRKINMTFVRKPRTASLLHYSYRPR